MVTEKKYGESNPNGQNVSFFCVADVARPSIFLLLLLIQLTIAWIELKKQKKFPCWYSFCFFCMKRFFSLQRCYYPEDAILLSSQKIQIIFGRFTFFRDKIHISSILDQQLLEYHDMLRFFFKFMKTKLLIKHFVCKIFDICPFSKKWNNACSFLYLLLFVFLLSPSW